MKKKLFVIIVIGCILLTGCSSTKEKIDHSKFINVLKKNNYQPYNYSSMYDIYDYFYMVETDDLYIKYIDVSYQKNAESLFIDECKNAIKGSADDAKKTTKSGENWSSYTTEDNENYYHVLWIDDMFIFSKTPIDNKSKIIKIFNELEQ